MSDDRILKCVELAVKDQNFIEYSVKIHKTLGKSGGYLSKVTAVTVTGSTKTGEKVLDLFVKTSTTNELLRKQIPIKHFFQNEIHIYDKVVPAFHELGKEMGVEEFFLQFLPTCYGTNDGDAQEELVLENLKSQGFDMWDRKIPMTFEHIRLVLQTFGKWNALSLAFKRKQPQDFEKLAKQKVPMFAYYIIKVQLDSIILKFFEDVRNFWKDDPQVAQIHFSLEDVKHVYSELVLEDSDHQVIMHGDSWTNNFMFKPEAETKVPSDLRLIDWQFTGLASPVLDLSVFIYSCVDTNTYKNVEELLKIYYETLNDCLLQLGCSPSEVFSFQKLTEHWKRFSRYGLLLGTFFLKFCFSEDGEAPDFVETAEKGKEFLENFAFNIANKEKYYKRSKSNILHYISNLE